MQKQLLFVCIVINTNFSIVYGISTITFFIRPYPFTTFSKDLDKLRHTLKEPAAYVAKALRRSLLDPKTHDGIFSSYWGYLAVSDFNGQITFPRKQIEEKFYLLITSQISPVFMIGNTIHHWELDDQQPLKFYSIERNVDARNKVDYWHVAEESVPVNKRIPINTIIIFAKPQDIFVPLGDFVTTDNPQLVLPDIYARKGLNSISPALWVLKMRQFFGPLPKDVKKISETYYAEQLRIP